MIKIPNVPFSALIFYFILVILWNFKVIPSPIELINILEDFYKSYGYISLILATLLEGLSYICLYVPGAFIIALTVFFSNKSFLDLVIISVIVATTLTVAALVNYLFGIYFSSKKVKKELIPNRSKGKFLKSFVLSMLHPNFLAFYFLNAGLKRRSIKEILYVPIFMFPYGMVIAFILSAFSNPIRQGLENPTFLLIILIIWFIVSFYTENKLILLKKIKRII